MTYTAMSHGIRGPRLHVLSRSGDVMEDAVVHSHEVHENAEADGVDGDDGDRDRPEGVAEEHEGAHHRGGSEDGCHSLQAPSPDLRL